MRFSSVASTQFHFCWRSAHGPQGERQPLAVRNAHDLGALAPLGILRPSAPPLLAGTNVPSTKHSVRSKPPVSWRWAARARRIFSITPVRTQFWKRRWTVWCGPYRSGKACQGAPVRRIHSTPLKTVRRSLQDRPRRSGRTGPAGRRAATSSRCLPVSSRPRTSVFIHPCSLTAWDIYCPTLVYEMDSN